MKTVSLFSGVGGLEADEQADVFCELDADCREVLSRRFAGSRIHDDVNTLQPVAGIDAVFGGWPCQDISVAGLRRGLAGSRSGLLFRMIDFARASGAGSIVAENVPNLLKIERGENFRLTLDAFDEAGYPYVTWRVLNARQFGLPHERRRVFIVASQDRKLAMGLLRDIPAGSDTVIEHPHAAGFYWTAGTHGINFSRGYSPTLKVGSSLSIPSPPAVFYRDVARVISPLEAIKLQGFNAAPFAECSAKAVHRMMGNAVARPVGRFVAGSLYDTAVEVSGTFRPIHEDTSLFGDIPAFTRWPPSGIKLGPDLSEYVEPVSTQPLATNLDEYIDLESRERLSLRAASGLLTRLERSGKACPVDLRMALTNLAKAS